MRRKRWLLGGVLVVIAGVVFVPATAVSYVKREHCWYTLSQRGHTEWPFGIESSHWSKRSPLEEYLAENAPVQLEHDWHMLANVGKTIYGDSIVFHDYRTTPARRLRPEVLRRWIAESNREEVLEFYELLKSGDRDRIEMKVTEIMDGSD